MKAAQQEVKHCQRETKDSYREKVEQKLRKNNMREVWEGVRTITGHKAKTSTEGEGVERVNDLNNFFSMFSQLPSPHHSCLCVPTAEVGEPLQRVFNMSLQLRRVPTLWKTSCIVPVPKKNRLFVSLLRHQVQHSEDSLQFAYRAEVGKQHGQDPLPGLFECLPYYPAPFTPGKTHQNASGPLPDCLDFQLPH